MGLRPTPGIAAQADLPIPGQPEALALIPTFIVVAVDATGMGIILPLLPFYSQRLGATPFIVGSLLSGITVTVHLTAIVPKSI
jgi:hypothetical protein